MLVRHKKKKKMNCYVPRCARKGCATLGAGGQSAPRVVPNVGKPSMIQFNCDRTRNHNTIHLKRVAKEEVVCSARFLLFRLHVVKPDQHKKIMDGRKKDGPGVGNFKKKRQCFAVILSEERYSAQAIVEPLLRKTNVHGCSVQWHHRTVADKGYKNTVILTTCRSRGKPSPKTRLASGFSLHTDTIWKNNVSMHPKRLHIAKPMHENNKIMRVQCTL